MELRTLTTQEHVAHMATMSKAELKKHMGTIYDLLRNSHWAHDTDICAQRLSEVKAFADQFMLAESKAIQAKKDLIVNVRTQLLDAVKLRSKKHSVHREFNGIYQDLIDGRLPIDIDYFKSKFEVIHENGKPVFVYKDTHEPASWCGKTTNNVTLNDYSNGTRRYRIYQVHRIVWAMAYNEDISDTDIGYIDGNSRNYALSNLIKRK
tara:strand:+ start:413 stop:1033 length:621 start_codon:yes stop_codon:yes gene_type:complete